MTKLRILMLGNSFIFVNDLSSILSEPIGVEVVHHTRGGATPVLYATWAYQKGGRQLDLWSRRKD